MKLKNLLTKIIVRLDDKNIIRLSDEKKIKLEYQLYFDKQLDLDNPQTFNEKMQWLKLNDRRKIYTELVDKYEVKKFISNIIGDEYIIPTIGIYDRFEEINFELLPNEFVIKTTHDSGGIIICKDKSKFDYNKAKKKITKFISRRYYQIHREWPYKNVKPRIIVEKYMSNDDKELDDYKIHNFNGVPKIILVCRDRYSESGLKEDFFDVNWNHLNIKRPDHDNSSQIIEKPKELEKMLELSKIISKNIPFVRTDFYVINGKVYFGEITFYPSAGFAKFEPNEWDLELGTWLKLPETEGVINEK